MFVNSIPRFGGASRRAGWLAVVSGLSFLAQARATDPTIVSVVPANLATGVSAGANVVFTFSAAMDTTLTSATFEDTNGDTLTTTPTWSGGNTILTCKPTPAFPSPDEIIWFVTGQDTSSNSLAGTTYGLFTVGGGSSSGGCNPAAHTNTVFVLEESWLYIQTNTGPPAHDPTVPYVVDLEVTLVSNLTASAASVTLPNTDVSNLYNELDGQTFIASDAETNAAQLSNTWPSGIYTFKTTGASLPAVTVDFNIAQPNVPQLANYAALQTVDSTKPLTLSWNSFSNRIDTNEIFVNISYNACAGTGFYTNLPGTATSATIPAGALLPGSNYVNSTLGFINTSGTSNASPEYTAGSVRSSVTGFTLTTLGGSGSGLLSLTNPMWSDGKLIFDLTAPPGKTITVQYSATLKSNSWATLQTIGSGSGSISVTDAPPKTAPVRFYRAHD